MKRKNSPRRKNQRRRCADVVTKAAAYSLATGAGVCLVGTAAAEPIEYAPPSAPIVIGPGQSYLINIDNSGSFDLALTQSFDGNASAHAYGSTLFNTLGMGSMNAEALEAGQQVGTDTTDWASTVSLSEFVNNRAFLGLRFLGGDSQDHFGYLEISIEEGTLDLIAQGGLPGAPPFNELLLFRGAFESLANTAITTVPEPGGLALLAIGATGLAARRRKRDQAV